MTDKEKELYLKIHDEKKMSLECCKKDCKKRECLKGQFCQDLYIHFVYGRVENEI